MSNIYNDFIKLRDETKDIKDSKEVLRQLVAIAFDNEDTLPDIFFIYNVHLNTSELKQLMKICNINAKVEMTYLDWNFHLAKFKITMRNSTSI